MKGINRFVFFVLSCIILALASAQVQLPTAEAAKEVRETFGHHHLRGLQEGFLHQVCTPDGSVTCDFPFVCCLKDRADPDSRACCAF